MKLIRNSAIALTMLATAAVFAASGIEVLKTTTTENGIEVLSGSTEAPIGSYVEAVMEIGGQPFVVSVAMVNPSSGHAVNWFPMSHPHNHLDLRGPGGELLASTGGGMSAGVEFD